MKIELVCNITVKCDIVFAELAFLERRPELGLICSRAAGGDGRITNETVKAVLPGLPESGAKNVVEWAEMLGLCDARGLTELGKQVATDGNAPVPEQGVYRLWHTNHPVVGRRVLAVRRITPSQDKRFDDKHERMNVDVSVFNVDRKTVCQSVIDRDERFIIRDFPCNHDDRRVWHEPALTGDCRFRWTLDFDAGSDKWRIEGSIKEPQSSGNSPANSSGGAKSRTIEHVPESHGINVWRAIDELSRDLRKFGQWDSGKRLLAVPVEAVKNEEAQSFLRLSVSISGVVLLDKGQYDQVTFTNVPIGPINAHEAQKWAMRLLTLDLGNKPTYRTRQAVRTRFAQLTQDTPLADFGVTLPSHDNLLPEVANIDRAMFWSLAAPVDLAPIPPSDEDLSAMSVSPKNQRGVH
ncbi:MAG: hypothetical protein FWD57_04175 [Polyangiaceae bacterium]|nr:hypothetical protein [Polyangiaceae bacterium]